MPDASKTPGSPIDYDASLVDAVKSLSGAIFALVHEARKNGSLALHPRTYILRPNFSFLYTVDPTVMNFGSEYLVEETLEFNKLSEFVEGKVRGLNEFQVVRSIVSSTPRGDLLLSSFAFAVTGASVSAADLGALKKYVETLLGDLGNEVHPCKAKVWLTGLTLGSDCIIVSDSLLLRHPRRGDLQEKVAEESAHYAHALQPTVHFSCIADLRLPALYPMQRQDAVEKLVLALRLFRLGAIASSMYAFDTDSLDPMASVAIGGPGRSGRESYELTLADAPNLAKFLEAVVPLLPASFAYPSPKRDYISTGFYWYGEAFFAPVPLEGSVASSIACLEALFLESVQTEMSFRLGVRVAGFLRCFGLSALDVQAMVKQAYDVRSKYVHGDEQDKKWSIEKLVNLSRSVAEYSRLALLAFCQMKDIISRKDLLILVDNSLLNDESRIELDSLCSRVDFCRSFVQPGSII